MTAWGESVRVHECRTEPSVFNKNDSCINTSDCVGSKMDYMDHLCVFMTLSGSWHHATASGLLVLHVPVL